MPQVTSLLQDAALFHAPLQWSPTATVCTPNGSGSAVRLANVDQLVDPSLKEKLLAFTALINSQLAGITSEGNFWLSW